jgi:hypothetical protein
MFTQESTEYLSVFKEFLVRQQIQTGDPKIDDLIGAINRELSLRAERGSVH